MADWLSSSRHSLLSMEHGQVGVRRRNGEKGGREREGERTRERE